MSRLGVFLCRYYCCCCRIRRLWSWHSAKRWTHSTLNVVEIASSKWKCNKCVYSNQRNILFIRLMLEEKWCAVAVAVLMSDFFSTVNIVKYLHPQSVKCCYRLFLFWNLSLLFYIIESVFAFQIISQTIFLFDSSGVPRAGRSDITCILFIYFITFSYANCKQNVK